MQLETLIVGLKIYEERPEAITILNTTTVVLPIVLTIPIRGQQIPQGLLVLDPQARGRQVPDQVPIHVPLPTQDLLVLDLHPQVARGLTTGAAVLPVAVVGEEVVEEAKNGLIFIPFLL